MKFHEFLTNIDISEPLGHARPLLPRTDMRRDPGARQRGGLLIRDGRILRDFSDAPVRAVGERRGGSKPAEGAPEERGESIIGLGYSRAVEMIIVRV